MGTLETHYLVQVGTLYVMDSDMNNHFQNPIYGPNPLQAQAYTFKTLAITVASNLKGTVTQLDCTLTPL